MSQEARQASFVYQVAFLIAVCAAIVSAIVGSIAVLWMVAAALDGRWQGVVGLAVFCALAAAQAWLLLTASNRREAGQLSLGTIQLVISALPALVFTYWISL